MGFVKTAEEIHRLKDVLRHPRFVNAEMLSIEFLTTSRFVRQVLPPGLEPASEPLMSAMVGRWQSNCVGDYEGGALYVAARHGSIEATYVLAMYMTTDVAIMFGREVLGEPKKQCSTGLNRGGTRMSGWIERHGVRLITLEADLTTDLGAREGKGANFNVKATPACDGRGLEDDALLTLAEFDLRLGVNREGTGTVTLKGTVHDPLDEIPISEVRRATYIEGDLYATARPLARIPADQFLPYAFGRLDDLTALNSEPAPLGVA
jgi:acetoacetate decarboxylase